jgi:MoxR-like ATPase
VIKNINHSFGSVDDVTEILAKQDYIASQEISTIVFLALRMQRPILVEGPAGVGKTELAKAVSQALELELIHLQCYEGIDETKAIYEWEYAKQLLYTQILKEKTSELVSAADGLTESIENLGALESAFFSRHFLLPRPLLKAITSKKQTVLLIDEVDKPDPEFEAFLLEVLNSYEISIPEIGTLKAETIPIVFLTSNNDRDLSDALKRRCLHLYIDYPSTDLEFKIVKTRLPNANDNLVKNLVEAIHKIRKLELKKKPSISETIDWAESLINLNIHAIEPDIIQQTLGVISKYRSDHDLILENSDKVFRNIL